MELYPISDSLGYAELFTAARSCLLRARAASWQRGTGIVEGYELIQARRCGWFIVMYSDAAEGERYSGEWRKFVIETPFSTVEDKCDAIVQRLPRGARISIRIDPKGHDRSAAEL